MSESYVVVPPDSTGKKVRTIARTIGGAEVHDRVVEIASPTDGAVIDPRDISDRDTRGLGVVTLKGRQIATYSAAVAGSAVAANKHHLVIFNGTGSGKIIEILRVIISPEQTAAVTGYQMGYRLYRTTNAGSGGTAVTPNKMDTTNPDLPTQVTVWTNPTTAPTLTTLVAVGSVNPEETGSSGTPFPLYEAKPDEQPLTLREGEGVTVQQYATAGVGLFNVYIVFRVR